MAKGMKLAGGADPKGSVRQDVSGGMRATIMPGEVLSRQMGQYGKGHSYLPPGLQDPADGMPMTANHSGLVTARGSRNGGVGPTPVNTGGASPATIKQDIG